LLKTFFLLRCRNDQKMGITVTVSWQQQSLWENAAKASPCCTAPVLWRAFVPRNDRCSRSGPERTNGSRQNGGSTAIATPVSRGDLGPQPSETRGVPRQEDPWSGDGLFPQQGPGSDLPGEGRL